MSASSTSTCCGCLATNFVSINCDQFPNRNMAFIAIAIASSLTRSIGIAVILTEKHGATPRDFQARSKELQSNFFCS